MIYVNDTLLRDVQMFGVKRCGNHAIAQWILAHWKYYGYYNDCRVSDMVSCRVEDALCAPGPHMRGLVTFEDHADGTGRFDTLINRLPEPKMRVAAIRDPFNAYASSFKAFSTSVKHFTEQWNILATLCLSGILKPLHFDEWLKNDKYRSRVSRWFGDSCPPVPKTVWSNGGGSSFGSTEGVLDRSRHLSQEQRDLINNSCEKLHQDLKCFLFLPGH